MLAVGTSSAAAATPETPVNLGSAGNFTVLSKTGITDVFKTTIDGDVGTSPITRTHDIAVVVRSPGWRVACVFVVEPVWFPAHLVL